MLIKHLASVHRNIFCVGDEDQSIYRWRGADYRNVRRFEQDFPDAQVILLEQNYRSKQVILDTAMSVIDRAHHRRHKRLFTSAAPGRRSSTTNPSMITARHPSSWIPLPNWWPASSSTLASVP